MKNYLRIEISLTMKEMKCKNFLLNFNKFFNRKFYQKIRLKDLKKIQKLEKKIRKLKNKRKESFTIENKIKEKNKEIKKEFTIIKHLNMRDRERNFKKKERTCEFFTEGKIVVKDDGVVDLTESQVVVNNNNNINSNSNGNIEEDKNTEGNKRYDNTSIIIYDDFFKK